MRTTDEPGLQDLTEGWDVVFGTRYGELVLVALLRLPRGTHCLANVGYGTAACEKRAEGGRKG